MDYLYNKPESKTKRRLLRNNMPQPEQRLWYYLKGKGLKGCKFRRQYGVSVYTLDFYCPQQRLAIELDGDSHFNPAAERRDEVREHCQALHCFEIYKRRSESEYRRGHRKNLKIPPLTPPILGGESIREGKGR